MSGWAVGDSVDSEGWTVRYCQIAFRHACCYIEQEPVDVSLELVEESDCLVEIDRMGRVGIGQCDRWISAVSIALCDGYCSSGL